MSGLCGILDLSGAPVDPAELAPMVAAAAYRGRDGVERWSGAGGAFAYQSTIVTPESRRERQPALDPITGVVLMADVRLDDRESLLAALRHEPGLVAEPAPTDVDLLLAVYRAWGEEGVARLVGDFALVVWDPRRRRLFAARDAMGVRPFVYRHDGRRIHFASEVRQVLAAPGVSANLFEPAIAAHLVGRYEDPSWTPYEGVLRLPAGHTWAVEGTTERMQRFWDIDPDRRLRLRREADYVEAFRDVFERAVSDRLRAEGPLGVLLSGGVDSGSVASMAGHILRGRGEDPRRIHTYSWAFERLREADERHVSDLINDHYGFTPRPIAADDRGPLQAYPAHGPTRDGPFVGVYQGLLDTALARAREDGVGVMLSGNRGDLMVGEFVPDVPGLLRQRAWGAALADLRIHARWRRRSVLRSVAALLVRPVASDMRARLGFRRSAPRARLTVPPWVRSDLLARTGLERRPAQGFAPPTGLEGSARRARYALAFSGLQMSSLAWDDRIHAEAGVSFADPWSDRRLVEFVLAAPQWAIERMTEPKRIAREAMRGVVPEAARVAMTKITPYPLFRDAMERHAHTLIAELLTDPVSAQLGYVDADVFRDHFEMVRTGGHHEDAFWSSLTLEMWLRQFHERQIVHDGGTE